RSGWRLLHDVTGIVNVACVETAGGQPAKNATIHHSNAPSGSRRARFVFVVSARTVCAPPSCRINNAYPTAPLTGSQSNRTGDATLFAPSAGATSCGTSLPQLAARAIVNVSCGDFVPGQVSKSASTHHSMDPGGRILVIDVASPPGFAMTTFLPTAFLLHTRYSVAFATALHTSVTGAVTLVAPFAGLISSVFSLLHAAALIENDALFDATAGHAPNSASTYHWIVPLPTSCCSDVFFVTAMSSNASPSLETHTRYNTAPLTALQWNVTAPGGCVPLIGDVSTGA